MEDTKKESKEDKERKKNEKKLKEENDFLDQIKSTVSNFKTACGSKE